MVNLIIVALMYGVVLGTGELLHRTGIDSNATRKIIHIGGGVVSALLPAFISYQMAILIAVFFIVFVIISEKRKYFESIHNINWQSRGALLFPISLLVSIIIFWPLNVFAFQGAMLVLGISDGLASLVGRTWGRRGYYITALKTYEGSVVFFISTLLIFLSIATARSIFGFFPFLLMLAWAFILTMIEAVSKNGWDNVFIPLTTGIFLVALL